MYDHQLNNDIPFKNQQVKNKFASYPPPIRKKLLFIRQLIFETAAHLKEVGQLEETLKWGEPSYVTSETGSGSTVRIDRKKSKPDQYAVYFHCKTTLVETFKQIYGNLFTYDGNRSIIFHEKDTIPVDALADCIAIALTYHLNKNGRKQ